MANTGQVEKRTSVDAGYSQRRSLPFRISRRLAWLLCLIGVSLIGALDLMTGKVVWVGPAYMISIGLAAWALGWREAVFILATCMGFSLYANSTALYPYGGAVTPLDFLMRLPPILAIIFLLAHARRACETEWQLARTDPLTGALNRKAFFELVGGITESNVWHLLAYADLDGLKRINDAYGHERGDMGLKAFAAHVRAAIRKDDIFARIGGDEFLVYMAVRDAQSGLIVANRLHRAMNSVFTNADDALRCSVGVLILAPGLRSIDRELRVADELMYDAKQSGAALTVATGWETGGRLTMTDRWVQPSPMRDGHPDEFPQIGEEPLRPAIATRRSPREAA